MPTMEYFSIDSLEETHSSLSNKYKNLQEKHLKLNMSRGIPCKEQLNLSNSLLEALDSHDYISANDIDCRNYGILDGLPEIKALCAELLEVNPQEIIVAGNSSLMLEYDLITKAMLHPLPEKATPWSKLPKIKFLCPSPGYDRHFSICADLGIEMIPIKYHSDGPDMDMVEKLVAEDTSIKGIWCVPKYSNPTGITYSDTVVKRLATMPVKAPDFRIFWDNAYAVHHLSNTPDKLLNILSLCKQANHPNRVFIFASTSKITFPGSGIAMVASSEENIAWLKKLTSVQTIGPDKLNQLRHLRFFKDCAGIEAHMQRHAAILAPKFKLVLNTLQEHFGDTPAISWSNPHGGYFISLNTPPGCAKKVVEKVAAAGVVLTPAGATFPYGLDPEDRNIRIAPTYPPLEELKQAMELLVLSLKLVIIEQELARRKQ